MCLVYGNASHPAVQSVMLALDEKRASWRLAPQSPRRRGSGPINHPLGGAVVLDCGDVRLFDLEPILRFIDRAFDGPALTPRLVQDQARMDVALSLMSTYLAPAPQFTPPTVGGLRRARREAASRIETCLKELERLKGDDPYLAGMDLSLADLVLVPRVGVGGGLMLRPRSGLALWSERMSSRVTAGWGSQAVAA